MWNQISVMKMFIVYLKESVLRILIFILYITNIKGVIKTSCCHLYADDTIFIQSASDPDSLIESLERKLLNIDNWLESNKMTINTKKLRGFSLVMNHILRSLTTKLSSISTLHLMERTKLSTLECILTISCNRINKLKTSPKRCLSN